MIITPADFDDPQVRALLQAHVNAARANSPPGLSFALDTAALQTPDIVFWAAWAGADLLGFAALITLSPTEGEVKSMRTHPDHVRKGVAAALVSHIIAEARACGFQRLSLETGASETYAPARALYARFGFKPGAVFGDYPVSDFNVCMHLDL
jgi:putative acetyltransferase